jgi:hypothetical protein
MNIDKNAPLVGKKEVIINASLEKVWKIQTDINGWPSWQKNVSEARLKGELKKGTKFFWKAMGMKITSILEEVEPKKKIGWSGKSLGMSAVHIWYFEKEGNNTRVVTEEFLSGIFPKIIKLFKPNFLEQSLENSLEELKKTSEKK